MTANEFYASLSGKRITFVGVGRSNLPLIEQFKAHGAAVSVRDKRSEAALGEDGEALKKLGAKLICGEDYLESIDEDMLFRAPGVPYLLPELQKARANGVAVTSEMEVFFDLCPCKIYAVTGSDGKTTTTSVIAEMLKAAGKTVHLGGNIGRPLLPEIRDVKPEDVAVVELSAYLHAPQPECRGHHESVAEPSRRAQGYGRVREREEERTFAPECVRPHGFERG